MFLFEGWIIVAVGLLLIRLSILSSKTFLFLITAATALIVVFPYYAKAFYPKLPAQKVVEVDSGKIQTATFTIKGVTYAGCEEHVNTELAKVPGVIQSVTSYAKRNSVVRFDKTKATVDQLQNAINITGYKVVDAKIEPNGNNN